MAEWTEFLKLHPDIEMLPNGKCRCRLTGHEMIASETVAKAHLNGKRYKKSKQQEVAKAYDFDKYTPNIVQSKKDPSKLFCHLTKKTLNKVPEEVEIHVNGRRFKARLREREERKARKAAKIARQEAKKAKHSGEANEDLDPALALGAVVSDGDDDDDDEDDDTEESELEEEDSEIEAAAAAAAGAAEEEDGGSDFEVVAAQDDSSSDEGGVVPPVDAAKAPAGRESARAPKLEAKRQALGLQGSEGAQKDSTLGSGKTPPHVKTVHTNGRLADGKANEEKAAKSVQVEPASARPHSTSDESSGKHHRARSDAHHPSSNSGGAAKHHGRDGGGEGKHHGRDGGEGGKHHDRDGGGGGRHHGRNSDGGGKPDGRNAGGGEKHHRDNTGGDGKHHGRNAGSKGKHHGRDAGGQGKHHGRGTGAPAREAVSAGDKRKATGGDGDKGNKRRNT